MGMSASQGRFMELTARKSNVEYHGQQINQQRTELANQSASYNSQLLNLSVPTPPNTTDFTKTAYTFKANGVSYTLEPLSGYNAATRTYTVNTIYTSTEDVPSSGKAYYTRTGDGTATAPYVYTSSNGITLEQTSADDVLKLQNLGKELPGVPGGGYDATKNYFKYTSTDGTIRYLAQTELDAATGSTPVKQCNYYYMAEDSTVSNKLPFENSSVVWDESSNRMVSFTDADNQVHNLSVTTTTDEEAYNNAMNKYKYDQAAYEKQMSDINAKTSLIQQQDKGLELQLKQLDTEQSAISTELDAVKKVISKNVESSFKTFNA